MIETPAKGLLNEERRREILVALHRDGRVLVKDLARRFRISQITIRKDLEFLDGQGVIQRTHGGALPVRAGALLDPTVREKRKASSQAKNADRAGRVPARRRRSVGAARFRDYDNGDRQRAQRYGAIDGDNERVEHCG